MEQVEGLGAQARVLQPHNCGEHTPQIIVFALKPKAYTVHGLANLRLRVGGGPPSHPRQRASQALDVHTTGRVSANDLRKSRLLSDMQRLALVHMSGDPPDAIRLAPFYRSGRQQKAQLVTSMPLM